MPGNPVDLTQLDQQVQQDQAPADASGVQSFDTLDQLATADLGSQVSLEPSSLLTSTSQIGWETQKVQPPSNLYVTISDRIQIAVWLQSGSFELDILGRLLEPDGSIKLLSFQIPAVGNGMPSIYTFNLAEGFLLDIIATSPSFLLQRGSMFVQVSLVRGALGNPSIAHVLIQDYVWTRSVAQWPGTPIRDSREGPGHIVATAVSVLIGSDWAYQTPTGTRTRIRMIYGQFATNATVANREVQIVVLDSSGDFICLMGSPANQTASQTIGYGIAPGLVSASAPSGGITIGLPADLMLEVNWTIESRTNNLQATDQWSGVFVTVETWIAPLT